MTALGRGAPPVGRAPVGYPVSAVALWIVLAAVGLLLAGGLAFLLRRPPVAEVAAVRQGDVDRVLAASGRVVPHKANVVLPAVGGRLLSVEVEEGDPVDAGDTLARLDDREARAQTQQTRAALQGVSRELAQARRDLARMESLEADGVISRQDLEASRLLVQRLEAAAREANAALDAAGVRQEDHVIRAPFAGRILSRYVDAGQQVGPSTPLFEVGDRDPRVAVEVDEALATEIRPGLRATGALSSSLEQSFELTVTRVATRIDEATGTTELELAFEEAAEPPPIGSSMDVNLVVDKHDSALLVPREAVVWEQSGAHVMAVRDGLVSSRPVRVIDWPAPWVVVLGGLEEGDLVVLDPRAVSEGDRVRTRREDDAV